MTSSWHEKSFQDFDLLEDNITKFVHKYDLDEMLRMQLNELEMLESMFSNPGEFSVYDYSVVVDINDYLDGKTTMLPSCLDFTINLPVGIDNTKLEVCVNLPHGYPATEPDVYVRNESLTRNQQRDLNAELASYILSLDRGEICICSVVSWLQENSEKFFNKPQCDTPKKQSENNDKTFMRYWIYSHHIYSKIKRREILDLAHEFNLTGFCLPGRPGIICCEGWNIDCEDWWQKIKSMNWKKIMCKKKEEVPLINGHGNDVDKLRKFKNFHEIAFEGNRNKSREARMDMGEFFRYLSQHDCGYVFKDYFGVDGKVSTPSSH